MESARPEEERFAAPQQQQQGVPPEAEDTTSVPLDYVPPPEDRGEDVLLDATSVDSSSPFEQTVDLGDFQTHFEPLEQQNEPPTQGPRPAPVEPVNMSEDELGIAADLASRKVETNEDTIYEKHSDLQPEEPPEPSYWDNSYDENARDAHAHYFHDPDFRLDYGDEHPYAVEEQLNHPQNNPEGWVAREEQSTDPSNHSYPVEPVNMSEDELSYDLGPEGEDLSHPEPTEGSHWVPEDERPYIVDEAEADVFEDARDAIGDFFE